MKGRRWFLKGLVLSSQLLAVWAYANGVKVIPEHKPPPPCKAGETRPSESQDYGPTAHEGFTGQVQNAFVKAFQSQGVAAGPEHVTISDTQKDSQYFTFFLRVSRDRCLLPHIRAISRQCIRKGSQEGATYILIGSVQRVVKRTRANVRIVRVETGEIISTGKGDSNGTDTQAIEEAVGKALDTMDFKITCAKGVNR